MTEENMVFNEDHISFWTIQIYDMTILNMFAVYYHFLLSPGIPVILSEILSNT